MPQSDVVKGNPLERYFLILEVVAAHPSVSIAEAAELCELPLPTAHRLIQALRLSGLIAPGEKRKHLELGGRLLRLLQSGSEDSWIKIVVQKTLDEIASDISETSYFAKLQKDEVVSVAWATPTNGLRGHVIPGLSQPLHAAACAKAILAHQAPDLIERLLSRPLPKLCENTKTRLEDVLLEHQQVRKSGFATCVNENEAGITAIACPILAHSMGTNYSIGVMSLSDRWTEDRIAEAVNLLQKAASHLSKTISRIER